MGFYDLSKEERVQLTAEIQHTIQQGFLQNDIDLIVPYFEHQDIYIRKAAYLAIGRIYNATPQLRDNIIEDLKKLHDYNNELVRQTVVNASGEIGMFHFKKVQLFFDNALQDPHHKVRNAVIGSLKKMSQKNPKPVLQWADMYMTHTDLEIRREVCHGIELRGRTHPQDVLPLLKKLQFEQKKRVRDTLVHVLGQISYKKDCLSTVIQEFISWEDTMLVKDALLEIIDVHSKKRYAKFTALTQKEVIEQIDRSFPTMKFNKTY